MRARADPSAGLGAVTWRAAGVGRAGTDVAVASSNSAAVLGVAPEALLDSPVADILGAEQAAQLHQAASDDDGVAATVPVRPEERAKGYQLEVSVHRATAW
jgi:light-regulated signal transduction histidine kinase (bacteriophytochrome)